jgi:hypothetical protein
MTASVPYNFDIFTCLNDTFFDRSGLCICPTDLLAFSNMVMKLLAIERVWNFAEVIDRRPSRVPELGSYRFPISRKIRVKQSDS